MSLYLKLIDIDNFCEKLEGITNPKTYSGSSFTSDGLSSQQIFGPMKSYTCICKKNNYHGPNPPYSKCPECHVEIASSEMRKKTFAKITLPFAIMNPLFFYVITNNKTTLKRVFVDLLMYRYSYYYDEEGKLTKIIDENQDLESIEVLQGLNGVIKIVDKLIEEDPNNPSVAFVKDNYVNLVIHNIVVIPPTFRPNYKDANNVVISDNINQIYSLLLVRCGYLKNSVITINEKDDLYRNNFKYIQQQTLELYDHIISRMSKKKGLLRNNILGKRVDFSGRAVISPDPTLNLDECRIPYVMLLEILKPQLVSYLITKRVFKWFNDANKYIEECIKKEDYSLFDHIKDFCKDKYCILNRQPTLHRMSIFGFKVIPHIGKTIQIHPMVCHPYNADFDGDSLCSAVCIKFMCDNITHKQDKQIVTEMSDILDLGLFDYKSEKTKEGGIKVTKYSPKEGNTIQIKAIDTETGDTSWKKITEYSVHENLDMYKLEDPQGRFRTFWSSTDHSLLVYDESDGEIKKVTPLELLDSPNGKYIIQEKDHVKDHSRLES